MRQCVSITSAGHAGFGMDGTASTKEYIYCFIFTTWCSVRDELGLANENQLVILLSLLLSDEQLPCERYWYLTLPNIPMA